MTQERSKVIKETENPFGDDEEEEAERIREQQKQGAAGPSRFDMGSAIDNHAPIMKPDHGSKYGGGSGHKKSKSKSKTKGGRKFDLEAEKDKMKSVIAESSIASTGLMNSLQTINREKERISENRGATQHFEACKLLRRRILRYVSLRQTKLTPFGYSVFCLVWARQLTMYLDSPS